MSNTNCLKGIRCPKCAQEHRFFIIGGAQFEVTDDGSESVGDHEWDDDSPIRCPECLHEGKVRDFHLVSDLSPHDCDSMPFCDAAIIGTTGFTTYQLAPDHTTYGSDAGKFIVTSADHEREFSGPMSQKDATNFVEAIEAIHKLLGTTPKLFNSLRSLLPYAEAELASLQEAQKRDGGLEAEVAACDAAITEASKLLAQIEAEAV